MTRLLRLRLAWSGQTTRQQIMWAVVSQAAPLVTTLAVTPYLLTTLGLARYGVWTLTITVAVILSSLDGGLNASLLRWLSLHRGRSDDGAFVRLMVTIALAQLLLATALGLVLYVCAPQIVGAFNIPAHLEGEAGDLLRYTGPLLLLLSLNALCSGALQALNQFKMTAVAAIATQVTYLGFVFALVHHRDDLRSLIFALLIGQAAGLLLSAAACSRSLHFRLALMPRAEISNFWSYAWRVQITSLTALVNLEADALIVAVLLPVRYVGLYSLGAMMATYIRNLPLWTLPPIATRLFRAVGAQGSRAVTQEFRYLHSRWMSLIVGYGLVGMLSGGVGLVAWLGRDYWPAALVCAILSLGNTVNLATAVMSTLTRAIGRPELEARYGAIVVVVNIALTIPAGVLFGLYGVVAATAIGQVIGSAMFVRMLKGIQDDLGRVLAGTPVRRTALALLTAAAGQVVILLFLSGVGLGGLMAAVAVAVIALIPLVATRQVGQIVAPIKQLASEG